MCFLKESNNQPLVLWHGTCAEFDEFYPLSQFAVDKHISDCAAFYTKHRQPPTWFFHKDYDKIMMQKTKDSFAHFLNTSHPKKKPALKEKRADFKIIPVYLKMKNPLILHRWGFDLQPSCSELVWAILKNKGENLPTEETSAYGDFIFKDTYQAPIQNVKKELALGHLFSISDNENENRYRLCAQRFIFFMEKLGYDGILYDDYYPYSVDAWREGKIKDFDGRAYVIFHPDQVVRLDKKIEVPVNRPDTKEKIELNKIFYRYRQKYHPEKIGIEQKCRRLEFWGCIENGLHFR